MPRRLPTLARRQHPLAPAAAQLALLDGLPLPQTFDEKVAASGRALRTTGVDVLQINVGKRCNQTCRHCHVDAGPERKEVMPDEVIDACLSLLERAKIPRLDITGGAPELHPRFREIVSRARALGAHVMDRCNLTILTLPHYRALVPFLAEHRVEVVASLPAYAEKQTDAQRGDGVFARSIAALRALNAVGYGDGASGLLLNLVTNPVGAFLPPSQASLEALWKREMKRLHGVEFDRLFAITNMPIARYLEYLVESGNLERYVDRLTSAFNPRAVDGLMCRFTLSVGWDGKLYDCDFNQMLELELPRTIFEVLPEDLVDRTIRTARHCFGCTAGAGSSCGGATA